MEIISRNNVYLLITGFFILITIWYLFGRREGYDNLDDAMDGVNSCGDPDGCKSNEEIQKEMKSNLSKQQAELAKPPSTPSVIISKSLLFTLKNNDKKEQIEYTLPNIPIFRTGRTSSVAMKTVPINYTQALIKAKVLSDSDNSIYMRDVDRDLEGIHKSTYNIGSLSVNYPEEKLTSSTFDEYVTNSSLYDIYTQKKGLVTKLSPTKQITSDAKYNKGPINQPIQIQLDSGRLNNNFVIITPKTNETFPSNFEITMTNQTQNTGIIFDLWGDSEFNTTKPQPNGHPNTILDNDTLTAFINKNLDTFGYSKQAFGETCYIIEDKTCMVGGLNVGKRAIHITKSGNIYDENDNIIGTINKQESTMDNLDEKFIINITNSENISGFILFITYPE